MANVGGSRWDYAATRILQYRALFTVPRFDFAGFAEAGLQSLPFRLGESRAEAAIPYAFDDALVGACELAVDDLAALISRRRESESENRPSGQASSVSTDERRLLPAGYASSAFPEGSPAQMAALRAVRLDPGLDSGVLEAWLAHGKGRALLAHLGALFRSAAEAAAHQQGASPYFLLAAAGAYELAESAKSRAKRLVSRLYPYEKLEKTVGFALYAVIEAAAEQALGSLRESSGFDPRLYAVQQRAALTPLALCTIRNRALQNDLNPWGLPSALALDLDQHWLSLLSSDPDPRSAERRLQRGIREDDELRVRSGQAGAILRLQRAALDVLGVYGGQDSELTGLLLGIAECGESAFTWLANPKRLLTGLARFDRSRRSSPAGDAACGALGEALRGGTDREDAIPEIAACFTCLALDRVVASGLDSARRLLRDRRADHNGDQLATEYEAGRLYRLSSDGKDLRRELSQSVAQGHLFIDLKNFTQRTHRAKELVMAEFLRVEFYQPILQAAAALAQQNGGERALVLQNLLGDAAVFSGELPVLIELARSIQRSCRAYGEKLRARAGGTERELLARKADVELRMRKGLEALRAEAAKVEQEIARKLGLPEEQREQALWSELQQRVAQLESRAEAAAARGEGAEEARARQASQALQAEIRGLLGQVENLFGASRDEFVASLWVGGDRQRLKALERKAVETRNAGLADLRAIEEDLRAQRGFGLEAGLFITHGAPAEVVLIRDDYFGEVKLAVAEKINEAARGTARNGILKAKLDATLEKARGARGGEALELPFRVYVDSAYNLLLPADLNEAIDTAVRDRDPTQARRSARELADRVLTDLARTMGLGDGQPPEVLSTLSDIYNTGEALTVEALNAYLASTGASRYWFRKTVASRDLHAQIRQKFLFLSEELELVVSVPRGGELDKALAFRRAGQVQFRGFEGKPPTVVYELLRPDSSFWRLLVEKHLGLWAVEAEEAGPQEPPA